MAANQPIHELITTQEVNFSEQDHKIRCHIPNEQIVSHKAGVLEILKGAADSGEHVHMKDQMLPLYGDQFVGAAKRAGCRMSEAEAQWFAVEAIKADPFCAMLDAANRPVFYKSPGLSDGYVAELLQGETEGEPAMNARCLFAYYEHEARSLRSSSAMVVESAIDHIDDTIRKYNSDEHGCVYPILSASEGIDLTAHREGNVIAGAIKTEKKPGQCVEASVIKVYSHIIKFALDPESVLPDYRDLLHDATWRFDLSNTASVTMERLVGQVMNYKNEKSGKAVKLELGREGLRLRKAKSEKISGVDGVNEKYLGISDQLREKVSDLIETHGYVGVGDVFPLHPSLFFVPMEIDGQEQQVTLDDALDLRIAGIDSEIKSEKANASDPYNAANLLRLNALRDYAVRLKSTVEKAAILYDRVQSESLKALPAPVEDNKPKLLESMELAIYNMAADAYSGIVLTNVFNAADTEVNVAGLPLEAEVAGKSMGRAVNYKFEVAKFDDILRGSMTPITQKDLMVGWALGNLFGFPANEGDNLYTILHSTLGGEDIDTLLESGLISGKREYPTTILKMGKPERKSLGRALTQISRRFERENVDNNREGRSGDPLMEFRYRAINAIKDQLKKI